MRRTHPDDAAVAAETRTKAYENRPARVPAVQEIPAPAERENRDVPRRSALRLDRRKPRYVLVTDPAEIAALQLEHATGRLDLPIGGCVGGRWWALVGDGVEPRPVAGGGASSRSTARGSIVKPRRYYQSGERWTLRYAARLMRQRARRLGYSSDAAP